MNTDAFKVLFFFRVEVVGMEQMPSFWRNQPLDIIGSLLSCPLGTVLQMKLNERKKKRHRHTLLHMTRSRSFQDPSLFCHVELFSAGRFHSIFSTVHIHMMMMLYEKHANENMYLAKVYY